LTSFQAAHGADDGGIGRYPLFPANFPGVAAGAKASVSIPLSATKICGADGAVGRDRSRYVARDAKHRSAKRPGKAPEQADRNRSTGTSCIAAWVAVLVWTTKGTDSHRAAGPA